MPLYEALQSKSSGMETQLNSNLPVCTEYNFRQFKPGDKVLIRRGRRLIETVIPELDGDGNIVPT